MANSAAQIITQITTEGDRLQGKSDPPTLKTWMNRDSGGVRLPAIAAAYVHVPFCFHKCHYCDFYSIVDTQGRQRAFVERLIAEMRAVSHWVRGPLNSIFVGGGTPTLLELDLWERLLTAMTALLPLASDGEFTVEANPETVTPELAAMLQRGGVNRVSIGAQSFDLRHLKTLERWHDPANVARSVGCFRHAGIEDINLDLIFGVPGQSLQDWQDDLVKAIELKPTHVSCYGLMYEPNTPLTVKMKSGIVQPIDQDLEAAMYECAIDYLAKAGFEQYEISNWALLSDHGSARCRHNLAYWRNENWWAFGPSASGHIDGLRWKNVGRLSDYLDCSPWPPVVDVEQVDEPTRAGESFMLGLRLMEGIANDDVQRLLQASGDKRAERQAVIAHHIEGGLLQQVNGRLRLTSRGRLLANEVLTGLV